MNPNYIQILSEKIVHNMEEVMVGQKEVLFDVLVCLYSGGHLLLEDVPGAGKTMLAKSLAASISGTCKRISMTPDLMPQDLTGVSFFNMKTQEFQFLPGPVFTNLLIADELNRSTPRTQSGLLECMEEGQVTIDGTTYPLEKPFFVIATQNPIETQGVFPLPEASLDRFLIKGSMTSLDASHVVDFLRSHQTGSHLDDLKSVASLSDIQEAKKQVTQVHIDDSVWAYLAEIQSVLVQTEGVLLVVSNRGILALLKASKACAAIYGRDYVLPDDIKKMAPKVLAHRLMLKSHLMIQKNLASELIIKVLDQIPVPTEEELKEE